MTLHTWFSVAWRDLMDAQLNSGRIVPRSNVHVSTLDGTKALRHSLLGADRARGESTMKRTISWVAGLCLVALVGCSEDMGPVTAAWNQLLQTMTAKVDAFKSQYASMQAAVKALPAAADGDDAGKAQKGKLDQALASHGQGVAALDTFISTSKSSFDEAVKTGKVANAQKVIDDTKTRFEQLSANLTASAAAITSLIAQYKKHLDDMSKLVDTDFTDLDFKPGTAQFLFDRPTSKATLVKLVAYMKGCPELVVDLVGHTSNEGSDATNVALSVARAKAVKNYLVAKEGVEGKKFREISGVGARQNVVPEPAPGSPEAKKMGAKDLEEIRRKNRRITVHPVTPCQK
jgi:outer membrane protein OmpA-like peptidoglycan-associated protein